jgi:hypothetical protein
MNSKRMATVASQFSFMFDVCDAFLLGNTDINHERKNKVEINNLNMAKYLVMISKKEFKVEVKVILEL